MILISIGVEDKVSQKRVRNKGEHVFRFEWILRSYNVDRARAQIVSNY